MAKKEAETFMTPAFTARFTKTVFTKGGMEGGAEKFGITAIWTPANFSPREKQRWDAIMKAINDTCLGTKFIGEPWKDFAAENPKNSGLRHGKIKKDVAGFGPETRFANLTSQYPPGVVKLVGKNDDGTFNFEDISLEDGNTDEIYDGCVCRAKINLYTYNTKSKGIALGLYSIQKLKDGPKLSTARDAGDDFKDEDVEDDWLVTEEALDEAAGTTFAGEANLDDDIPF